MPLGPAFLLDGKTFSCRNKNRYGFGATDAKIDGVSRLPKARLLPDLPQTVDAAGRCGKKWPRVREMRRSHQETRRGRARE